MVPRRRLFEVEQPSEMPGLRNVLDFTFVSDFGIFAFT